MNKLDSILNGLANFIMAIIIIIIIGCIIAWPLQWIWNDVIVNIFNLRKISVGEALELYILCCILFGRNSEKSKS